MEPNAPALQVKELKKATRCRGGSAVRQAKSRRWPG